MKTCLLKTLVTLGVFYFTSHFASPLLAQNNIFLELSEGSETLSNEAAERVNRIRSREVTKTAKMVRIRLDYETLELENGTISVNIVPGRTLTARRKLVEHYGPNRIGWLGDLVEEEGYISIVYDASDNGQSITGTIRTTERHWSIEPVEAGRGVHMLVEKDRSKLRSIDQDSDQENPNNNFSGSSVRSDYTTFTSEQNPELNVGNNVVSPLFVSSTTTPIRVMVVYTAEAKSEWSNVTSLVTTAIQEANTALINSGMYLINGGANSYKFTLRYIAQVNYSENASTTNFRTHVNRLQDGTIPNVQSWRNTYGADIVAMVVKDDEQGGIAHTINASAGTAFLVINGDYLTGENVLDHEMGHLIGGKHANDSRVTPGTAYSRGYITSPNSYATVMVQGGVSNRIPYWSDPGETLNSNVLGTTSLNDMVRMQENRNGTVAGFKTDPAISVSISGPTVLNAWESGYWYASVTGGGSLYPCRAWYTKTASSSTWTHKVTHCNGTQYYNAAFTETTYLKVVVNDDAGQTDETTWYVSVGGGGYEANHAANDQLLREIPEETELSQNYPNPFNPNTNIRFALKESGHVSLKVYNIMGRHIATIVNGILESGYHDVSWNASGLASGLYYYTMDTKEFTMTRHMIFLE